MSFFLSSCFSFQTRANLVLVKFYYNAAVWRFMKTFRKFAGKRLWWKPFLGNFKLFKMDSGKDVFLSVFRSPFYGCFQTLNRNTFLWMIKLSGANTLESSKICQKVEVFSGWMPRNTLAWDFFILSTHKLYLFSDMYSSKKKSVKLKRLLFKDKSSQNFLISSS